MHTPISAIVIELQANLLLLALAIEDSKSQNNNPEFNKIHSRNPDGTFGNKTGSSIKKAAVVSVAVTENLLKDKGFRDRAGLTAGAMMMESVDRLAQAAKVSPDIINKFDELTQSLAEKLAGEYGDDLDPFTQAIRKTDEFDDLKERDFGERLQLLVARYAALEEALEQPELFRVVRETADERLKRLAPERKKAEEARAKERREKLGKAVKASVPVFTALAIAAVPEVVIGVMLGQGLTEIAVATTVGVATTIGGEKVLDAAKITDPGIRLVAGLAFGAVAGKLISGGGKLLRGEVARTRGVADITWSHQLPQKIQPIDPSQDFDGFAKDIQALSKELDASSEKGLKKFNQLRRFGLTKATNGQSDWHLKSLLRMKGHDDLPELVSKSDFDSLIAPGSHEELFRGISASGGVDNVGGKQLARQFQSGDLYVGGGTAGSGTYTAKGEGALEAALGFAKRNKGGVLRMALPPEAKVVEENELRQLTDRMIAHFKGTENLPSIGQDLGRLASYLGYDAMHVMANYGSRTPETVVLNRSILKVQKELAK